MFGCKEVIPPHLRDFDWRGTDNASWLMRIKKKIQYWLAIGPRGEHWYCKTRELPKTLFVKYGKGHLRYENTDGTIIYTGDPAPNVYLSRIQPWCRWSVALQWPLWFQFHIFWCQKSVVIFPTYKSDFGIKKLFTFGIGYKRDADRWHIPTLNFGGNFE